LLLYGQQVLDESAVRVPRADILQYAFVLAPIAELAPDLRHPVDGRTMRELWSAFEGGDQGIRRLAEPLL
jgi:2-amino-4-hydroxy-6-hydroxymethyldihydropteridine diphosphokinase